MEDLVHICRGVVCRGFAGQSVIQKTDDMKNIKGSRMCTAMAMFEEMRTVGGQAPRYKSIRATKKMS